MRTDIYYFSLEILLLKCFNRPDTLSTLSSVTHSDPGKKRATNGRMHSFSGDAIKEKQAQEVPKPGKAAQGTQKLKQKSSLLHYSGSPAGPKELSSQINISATLLSESELCIRKYGSINKIPDCNSIVRRIW